MPGGGGHMHLVVARFLLLFEWDALYLWRSHFPRIRTPNLAIRDLFFGVPGSPLAAMSLLPEFLSVIF